MGIATTGTHHRADRAEEQKDYDHHDEQCVNQRLYDFVDGVVDVSRSVSSDFAFHSGRNSLWICSISTRTRLITYTAFAFGRNVNSHEDCFLSREPHLGVVIFRAELDVRDVAQPDRRFPSPGE